MATQTLTCSMKVEGWHASSRPVLPSSEYQHVLHAYFNHCPESPDGRWVLLFASQQDDAQCGDVIVLERATGKTITLASGVRTEDAHRQAYQLWVAGGRHVIFQNCVNGRWQIERVCMQTFKQDVIHFDRLLGWSQPGADEALLYPPHWQHSSNRDLQWLDVHTGAVRTAVRAADVCASAQPLLDRFFPDRPAQDLSLFFPILSPDRMRLIFKLAAPAGGDFQSEHASKRAGLIVWDLTTNKLVGHLDQWGHPSWHPDSRQIVKLTHQLCDGHSLQARPALALPHFHGSHPSISPNGRWYVSDLLLHTFDGQLDQWGVALASMDAGQWAIVHRNETAGTGTTSWRPPHPHPVFNAQSNRVYFNTQYRGRVKLHVLEADM